MESDIQGKLQKNIQDDEQTDIPTKCLQFRYNVCIWKMPMAPIAPPCYPVAAEQDLDQTSILEDI